MDFRFIDDEYVWNIPLSSPAVRGAQFLQSWEWGVFQQTFGRAVHRIQIVEEETVMAIMQVFEYPLPFGKRYLYAPRGPVILSDDHDALSTIVHLIHRACREVGYNVGAMFVRLEPMYYHPYILENVRMINIEEEETRSSLLEELRALGFRSGFSVQPMDELAVVLDKDEDDLLDAMHEKTRYNIRLAIKHGVRARLIEQPDYAKRVFPFFWSLLQETAKRQKIRTHSRQYYERMVDLLVPRGVLKLMLAEYDNKIIAAHLLSVFGDTVYYLHGGSSYDNRQLMAPYLFHWEEIKLAKRMKKKFYNFGGIVPAGETNHSWQNLTKFNDYFVRDGETGQRLHYIGAFDLVFQPMWYRIYKAARHLQSFIRIR